MAAAAVSYPAAASTAMAAAARSCWLLEGDMPVEGPPRREERCWGALGLDPVALKSDRRSNGLLVASPQSPSAELRLVGLRLPPGGALPDPVLTLPSFPPGPVRSTENGGALRWPPLLLGEAARLKMGRVPDVGRSANSAYGLPLASLLSLAMRRDSSAAAADSDACAARMAEAVRTASVCGTPGASKLISGRATLPGRRSPELPRSFGCSSA
mmetsp:Transcript_377/g.1107  ORF Transcript_377/g.1107 Transcript_377/m.1107 type:complete len:213 (+) Transcript_377:441-1079(+)